MKFQLLMVYRIQNSHAKIPPLNGNAIEQYCEGLRVGLEDDDGSTAALQSATKLVETTLEGLRPWREPPERTKAFTLRSSRHVNGEATRTPQ